VVPAFISNDTYYRDAFPIRSILHYLERAEAEIAARDLDTCDDKLGRSLVEAYHRTRLTYVSPSSPGGSEISCAQVKSDRLSEWWPVPAAPCLSTNLRANGRELQKMDAAVTAEGEHLWEEMRRERFVGSHLGEWDGECGETIGRTLLVIPRQDQWNP
jgi:hypothetical protein